MDVFGNNGKVDQNADHFQAFMKQVVDVRMSQPGTNPAVAMPSYMKPGDMCKVCGKPANGRHYGALTCEGCKSFFRRKVKQERPFGLQAKNLKQRSHCSGDCHREGKYCRYCLCINAGMDPKRVLNEKQRVAKRQLIEENRDKTKAEAVDTQLTADGRDLLVAISSAFEKIFSKPPADDDTELINEVTGTALHSMNNHTWMHLLHLYKPSIIRIIDFIQSIPGFKKLSDKDQRVLILNSTLDLMFFRLSLRYKSADMSLPMRNGVYITRSDAETVNGGMVWHILAPLFDFGFHMGRMELTSTEAALMMAVIALQTDHEELQDIEEIEKIHDLVLEALQCSTTSNPDGNFRFFTLVMKTSWTRVQAKKYGELMLMDHLTPDISQFLMEVFEDR